MPHAADRLSALSGARGRSNVSSTSTSTSRQQGLRPVLIKESKGAVVLRCDDGDSGLVYLVPD